MAARLCAVFGRYRQVSEGIGNALLGAFYQSRCKTSMLSRCIATCKQRSRLGIRTLTSSSMLPPKATDKTTQQLLRNSKITLDQRREVNFCSKKGKRKTVKAVAKRFKRLGSGKLKRWRAGKSHNMRKKSTNQKRRLRKPVIVRGKQLSKLNKMISGW